MSRHKLVIDLDSENSSDLFVIGDTHFGHFNIIKHCNRPFSSLEEMDQVLIDNWNKVVKSSDTVIFLGDFAYKVNFSKFVYYTKSVNGIIHFVVGNHDKWSFVERSKRFESINEILDLVVRVKGKDIPFLCSHYPFLSWKAENHGSIHLHGHSHDQRPSSSNRFNMSVEQHNYVPINIYDILKIAKPMLFIGSNKND